MHYCIVHAGLLSCFVPAYGQGTSKALGTEAQNAIQRVENGENLRSPRLPYRQVAAAFDRLLMDQVGLRRRENETGYNSIDTQGKIPELPAKAANDSWTRMSKIRL